MTTSTSLVYLIALPLAGAVILLLAGRRADKWGHLLATAMSASSFGAGLYQLSQMLSRPPEERAVTQKLFTWISVGSFNIDAGILLDQLSICFVLLITGVGTLIHIYSISYMSHDENRRRFFAYLNLFIASMLLLVLGDSYLNLYVGWEGVGLASYLLIGFWNQKPAYATASKKAFVMNRIGDMGLSFAIMIAFATLGSVSFSGVEEASDTASQATLTAIGIMLLIAAAGKSAQFPLQAWLGDAMAGPTPVSALIHAATMVTAGIFMVTRLNFLFDLTPFVQNIIAIVGAVTALVAATIGLVQNDIKKVLAYSTVSQLGLMFLALGLGAYEVAVFHVITHAFFKACLFLGSGSVIHALHGEQDMRNMGGLKKAMPITFWTMLISSLAIAGVFPFAGFWSKDEILMVAFEHNKVLWIVGSVASILTAFYMFRLMYLTFFKEFRGTEEQKHHLHESPGLITFPLIVLGTLAAVGGLINLPGSTWLHHYLSPLFSKTAEEHAFGSTEYMLMGIALVGAFVGIGIAYSKYIKQNNVPAAADQITGFAKVLYNKYYVDEFYETLFVKPINALSRFFRDYIETAVSGFVFGLGKVTLELGSQGRKLHNGNTGFYLFAFVLGVIGMISYLFLAQ
jgi:NADH-quinone oxidoreductase subunit L